LPDVSNFVTGDIHILSRPVEACLRSEVLKNKKTGILKVEAGNAVDDTYVAAPAVYDDTKVAAPTPLKGGGEAQNVSGYPQ
jgi:azurin